MPTSLVRTGNHQQGAMRFGGALPGRIPDNAPALEMWLIEGHPFAYRVAAQFDSQGAVRI